MARMDRCGVAPRFFFGTRHVFAALVVASCASSMLACSRSAMVSVDAGSGPYLTELTVSSNLTLVPTFSPSIHDYYVVCAGGTNSLTVSMSASPGAKSQLLQPTRSASIPQQDLSLDVTENEAIVAVATQGKLSTEYWVRCLPHDFQSMAMVKHLGVGSAPPGYYLIGDEQSPPTGAPAFAMVVDSNGVPVWYYAQPRKGLFEPSTGVFDVDSVVPGTISLIGWPSLLFSSPFEIHGLSPLETTDVSATGLALDPHELRRLTNGNFLIFTDQVETGIDLSGYPAVGANGLPFGQDGSLLPCDILEVDSKGNVVWKWVGTDHFDAVKDSTNPEVAGDANGDTVADPFHCNSIDVDPANGIDSPKGNLLISSRDMDSIFYIERSSGKVLWKMGGATYTKDNAKYIPVADPFYRQHDARFQPGWSANCGGQGQISLFDDETAMFSPARAVVYDVNVGAGSATECGEARATVEWEWSGSISSQFMGSFRILEDGSRVIGWGFGGQRNLVFTEVNAAGDDVLDFYFPDNSSSFRSIKVPLSALDLEDMRQTAGRVPASVIDAGGDGHDVRSADASSSTDAGTSDADGGSEEQAPILDLDSTVDP
jgi:hypothetical protein